jgi:hypothetical protein
MSHGNEMICQPVTLSGYAEWPKVADAVIEAAPTACHGLTISGRTIVNMSFCPDNAILAVFSGNFAPPPMTGARRRHDDENLISLM